MQLDHEAIDDAAREMLVWLSRHHRTSAMRKILVDTLLYIDPVPVSPDVQSVANHVITTFPGDRYSQKQALYEAMLKLSASAVPSRKQTTPARIVR